ncbi:MAG: hypothetical protein VB142_07550 [Burkholderia sp.]
MPSAHREALGELLRGMFGAVAEAIAHSRCRVTGETREADPGGDGQSTAQVAYGCEVANLAPAMERLRVVAASGRQVGAGRCRDPRGDNYEAGRNDPRGALFEPVSKPILERLGMPTQMRGD